MAETDTALIVVYTPGGERVECEGGTRFKTDEHNNLEITSGTHNNVIALACFNENHWERVVIEHEQDSG